VWGRSAPRRLPLLLRPPSRCPFRCSPFFLRLGTVAPPQYPQPIDLPGHGREPTRREACHLLLVDHHTPTAPSRGRDARPPPPDPIDPCWVSQWWSPPRTARVRDVRTCTYARVRSPARPLFTAGFTAGSLGVDRSRRGDLLGGVLPRAWPPPPSSPPAIRGSPSSYFFDFDAAARARSVGG
jgi:hypothetical protein